jgi:hypothetical protein
LTSLFELDFGFRSLSRNQNNNKILALTFTLVRRQQIKTTTKWQQQLIWNCKHLSDFCKFVRVCFGFNFESESSS